jgi:dihydrolipoamide dehydrogenase
MSIEVKVPDIGDFKEVEVIELLVKVGDVIKPEQSLITVESDKASMEIPSSVSGKITALRVKIGDKVKEGSVLLEIEANNIETKAETKAAPATIATGTAAQTPAQAPAPAAVASASSAAVHTGKADQSFDMLVIGAGPGGYSAAFRAADLGMNTVLIERYPTLGGVCLNVGCIPSKALLHTAAVIDEAKSMAKHGISFGEPVIDIDKLRGWKEQVIGKLTGGLAGMAKLRKVTVAHGVASFIDPHHVKVIADGKETIIRFEKAVIAVGSQAVKLPFLPDDPRVVDSTGALKLTGIPKRMLVIGGGIIGLEMGTVYSTLGSRLDVVEMMDGLMMGADRDLVKVWQKFNAKRFDHLMLNTKTTKAEATPEGIKVWFEGSAAPAEPQLYDMVLASVGRTPNGKKIAAENAGVAVSDRGFISVDNQMRTNVPHIFAIGDVVGQPMLAHKAVHEAHVASEVAAGQKSFFDARVIPSVAYTDPEVAWVGITEEEAAKTGIKIGKATFPWAASGRAIANGRDEGFTKLIFDEATHRVIGGGIVGTHAGDMIGEIALAIEMGADPTDIGKTIHPHPTLGESIGMAAELFEGVCTDLPPMKR